MEFGGGIISNEGIFIRPSSPCSKEASGKMKSVKGIRGGFAPPPFLTKTFKMVEDTETNSMISWNSCGTSIIIHDHLKFAMVVLPKYFKHSNFSSFIYQLNNYGFRKIGLRQYEYENRWFQAGQEQLLKNIKRRNDEYLISRRKRELQKQCFIDSRSEMDDDLENVEDKINLMKLEIEKLKCQVGDFQNRVATFKKDVENKESKFKEMIMFFSRIFGQSLVEKIKIIQSEEEEQEQENDETVKRRRLIEPQISENSAKPTDEDASGSPVRDQEANISIREANEPKQSDGQKMWKKFLEDDSVSENESQQELAKQQSKIDMAFDDLMVSKIVNGKEANMDVEDEVTVELWT